VQQTAAAEDDAGGDGRATGLQKITTGVHETFPPLFSRFSMLS
jgi:hypothetical protein